MIKKGDYVKVIGTTDCGGIEKECIKIGTICRVVSVDDSEKPEIYVNIEPINEYNPVEYWYSEKDVEKGHLEWVKE